jgi:hypothetical protein
MYYDLYGRLAYLSGSLLLVDAIGVLSFALLRDLKESIAFGGQI